MSRVLTAFSLLALLALLASLHSAAPPRSAKSEAAKKLRDLPLVDRMYSEIDFPGIEDPKTTLAEALEDLAKQWGVTFDIRDAAFKYEMLNDVSKVEVANPNPIPPVKARLCDVLQRILNRVDIPTGATWLMRDDRIEITSNYLAEIESMAPKYLFDPDPEAPAVFLYVLPRVNADFRNARLADALEDLTWRSGLNIVLDQSVAKKSGETRVTARLRNVSIDSAVLLLTSQVDLGMAKLDNVYLVTTEEKAAKLEKRHAALRPITPSPAKEKEKEQGLGLGWPRGFGSGIWKEPKK